MVLVVDQQALSERRARMLHDWHVNNGTDCGREVDTELRASAYQESGYLGRQRHSSQAARATPLQEIPIVRTRLLGKRSLRLVDVGV